MRPKTKTQHSREELSLVEYYRNSVTDSLKELQSSANGLTSAEVDKRLERDGYNELKGKKK
ncbi:cation-transporting P-type ATPase, partial [Paenibacillus sp.]|uniref:cation-transporting P-type ATPase n=1 Tax=Paenibacillus sp. TaxID=58172 RepID=UPI0037CBA69C